MKDSEQSKFLFLTTLIDLLLQVTFVLIILLYISSSSLSSTSLLEEIREFLEGTGITVSELEESWSHLVDMTSLERQNKALSVELASVKKENEQLKSKIASKKSGLDDPPCWKGSDNKLEVILNVVIYDEGLMLSRAWPDYREHEVKRLEVPMEQTGRLYSLAEFQKTFQRLKEESKSSHCRHYVRLMANRATKVDRLETNRDVLEDVFYIYKMRKKRDSAG